MAKTRLMTRSNSRKSDTSPRKMARHEIRKVLRDRILDGECGAGTKLIQGKLAKDFGVSVGVVREALLELSAWGLVETHDNRGVTVSTWNIERVLESYDIREMLEGLAARLCAGRMDDRAYAELKQLTERIFNAGLANDISSARLDREFHHRIVVMSGSRTLLRLSDSYRFINKMMWIGQPSSIPEGTRQKHLEILDAIYLNRPEVAEQAAREHVAVARRSIAELAAAGKFDPEYLA
jgi:DNA-binding GntR family transcriptional regulator